MLKNRSTSAPVSTCPVSSPLLLWAITRHQHRCNLKPIDSNFRLQSFFVFFSPFEAGALGSVTSPKTRTFHHSWIPAFENPTSVSCPCQGAAARPHKIRRQASLDWSSDPDSDGKSFCRGYVTLHNGNTSPRPFTLMREGWEVYWRQSGQWFSFSGCFSLIYGKLMLSNWINLVLAVFSWCFPSLHLFQFGRSNKHDLSWNFHGSSFWDIPIWSQ